MDIRRFPVLAASSTVGQALERMQEESISGIVVPRDHHVGLISFGELVARQVPRRTHLSTVAMMRVAPNITLKDARRLNMPAAPTSSLPLVQRARIESFLRSGGYFYAAFGPMRTHANIVSLSEVGMEIYVATPTDCYCTDPYTTHGYDRVHPRLCTRDDSVIVCR